MAEEPARPFRVVYPERVRAQVQEWVQKAEERGIASSLAEALQHIDQRLASEPLAWGEAQYRLHHLGLTVGTGFHERIQVRFAVDEQRQIVYVSTLQLLLGHPLGPNPG